MWILFRSLLLLSALVSLSFMPVLANEDLPAASTPVQELRQSVGLLKKDRSLDIAGQAIAAVAVLPALYEKYNHRLLWSESTTQHYLTLLTSIYEDGLSGADYHDEVLFSLHGKIQSAPTSRMQAEFDLLLSDSLMRLCYHLLVGKVDPVALDSNWNMQKTIADLDLALDLASAIPEGRVMELVDSLRPQWPIYPRLQAGLKQYRQYKEQGGWFPVLGGVVMKQGMTDARVVLLRRRLWVTGEMTKQNMDSPFFDEDVARGVELFQSRHGLRADGVVGQDTVNELNVPVEARINAILVNLERCRWVLHDLPEEFVFVDIAGFSVKLYKGKKMVWQSRVQVGSTYRKTPIFQSTITWLEMNPTWTIPATIFAKNILPKMRSNPNYLQEKDMQVITYGRQVVDEATIDWSLYPEQKFPYLIRQSPGPENALGQVKFMFANKHDVYLHDTPRKSLFDHDVRAFSSGCVRIEKPFEFAALLLAGNDIGLDEIVELVAGKKTKKISLKIHMPLRLLYATVTADSQGNIMFRNDIYGRDQAVLDGLRQPFSLRKKPVLP